MASPRLYAAFTDQMENRMVDNSSDAGELNKKRRVSEVALDGENRPTKRLRGPGTPAQNVDPDRLWALPQELFKSVIDNIDDIKDLENLSLANKSYHNVLGNTVKDISHRKYTREAAAAIYDYMMREGIPTVTDEQTIPGIMGHEALPRAHAAIARRFANTLGPIIRFLDEDRQRDFAAKIIAVSPNIRGEVVDGMVNHMDAFTPVLRNTIYEAVIDDFENAAQLSMAGTLEDATWRGNLTRRQLDRVFSVRMANSDAEQEYGQNVRWNYGPRLRLRFEGLNSRSRTQSTDRSAPYGLELTSDALKYNADRAARLDRFTEASEVLAGDAKTARGDRIAARSPRQRGR